MSTGALRIGFAADGVWKTLVGVAMVVLLRPLVEEFGAPGWLLGLTAVLVLASAAAEILYAVRSGAATHTKYLIAYDSVWILTSLAALVLAPTQVGWAWAVWLGYQAIAAPIIVVVFAQGVRRAAPSAHSAQRGGERY